MRDRNIGRHKPKGSGSVDHFNLGFEHRHDNFAVKFTGVIPSPGRAKYTFFTTSDDGSRLYIDSTESSTTTAFTPLGKAGDIELARAITRSRSRYFQEATTSC